MASNIIFFASVYTITFRLTLGSTMSVPTSVSAQASPKQADVVVVGASLSGLYMAGLMC